MVPKSRTISPQTIMRCVLYEMLTLALSVELLLAPKRKKMASRVDSREVLKTAALIKIRILFDFLYNEKYPNGDDFTAKNDFQKTIPTPLLKGCDNLGMFTKQSINKFIVHLTKERIEKPEKIPQPKFQGGIDALVYNAALILSDAQQFIAESTLTHGGLDDDGKNYLADFLASMARLRTEGKFYTGLVSHSESRDKTNPQSISCLDHKTSNTSDN